MFKSNSATKSIQAPIYTPLQTIMLDHKLTEQPFSCGEHLLKTAPISELSLSDHQEVHILEPVKGGEPIIILYKTNEGKKFLKTKEFDSETVTVKEIKEHISSCINQSPETFSLKIKGGSKLNDEMSLKNEVDRMENEDIAHLSLIVETKVMPFFINYTW